MSKRILGTLLVCTALVFGQALQTQQQVTAPIFAWGNHPYFVSAAGSNVETNYQVRDWVEVAVCMTCKGVFLVFI